MDGLNALNLIKCLNLLGAPQLPLTEAPGSNARRVSAPRGG